MTVTVTPATFTYVTFDADTIRRITADLLDKLGLGDRNVHVEVDETTPLARIRVDTSAGIAIRVESGAFEDPRLPRQQSERTTSTSLGRLLLRVRDRERGGFADAPPDKEMTLAQMAAWDTYCVGRLSRLGIEVNQQRWRYNFRNRHGFTDAADAAFDRIWSSDELTWDQLMAMTTAAEAA